MDGDKANGDGCLRKDFPGGWQGDKTDCFKAEGRTALQNEAYDFTRKLLQWRKNNEAIGKGSMKHFSIAHGTYVYQREYKGKSVVVIMNGTDERQVLDLTPYKEILPQTSATDFLSGQTIKLEEKLELDKRATLLLCF